jgi:hypothetical protein
LSSQYLATFSTICILKPSSRKRPSACDSSDSRPQSCDGAGRTIDKVLAFDLADLERHHDFIQWIFPLPEPSFTVLGSPILTTDDIAAIKASPTAQDNLARAVKRMAWFYEQTVSSLRARDLTIVDAPRT